jgi:hypothetical protein
MESAVQLRVSSDIDESSKDWHVTCGHSDRRKKSVCMINLVRRCITIVQSSLVECLAAHIFFVTESNEFQLHPISQRSILI